MYFRELMFEADRAYLLEQARSKQLLDVSCMLCSA